jgi:anti-sigma factor RsiW
MTMPHDSIDDELLSAWVDGELDGLPAQRQQVEAWLSEHPADAARVRQWAADRDALRERLAPQLAEPVPPRLRALVLGHAAPASPRWLQAAMAAALLLAGGAIGVLLGRQWPGAEPGGPQAAAASGAGAQGRASVAGSGNANANASAWVQRAAYAHSVYVPEPRHAVEVKAQEEHLARWLTRRIELPVKLFDLRDQGFELVGGRLLPDGPGKSAQLMYQDAQGTRITVYLRKPEQPTEAAFRYEQQGDVGLFYWVESGAGYALVGALPKERLLALAQEIYRQHPAPGAAPAPAAAASR